MVLDSQCIFDVELTWKRGGGGKKIKRKHWVNEQMQNYHLYLKPNDDGEILRVAIDKLMYYNCLKHNYDF